MFSSDRILALNVGASKVMLAEFQIRSGRTPELINYGTSQIGVDSGGEGQGLDLAAAIRDVMKSRGIRRAPLLLTLSGQVVFPRFVRLPAVGREKLLQMVQYEVEQNVPFPMEEIVWSHQFVGDDSSGEQSAMIVAAKVENVREVTGALAQAGLEPEIVDVAPMALCNVMRYSYPDLDGCSVILDIGARSTNLIFVEDEKIYSRCIPVAGNAITQDVAKGFQIPVAEAEMLKREIGFVSLGGVYASENEQAERVSKIVRNVATRLHAEISRSINFYRSQQGGSPPVRLFLTGGSAVLPHLDTFFREKLQIEVSHLNPFMNVGVGAKIDRDQVGSDAFVLAEVVGLALRRSAVCPIQINLMPPEIARHKTFMKRIPYFGVAAASVLVSLGMWALYQRQMGELYSTQREQVEVRLGEMRGYKSRLDKALQERGEMQEKADALVDLIYERSAWLSRVEAVRKSLFEGMWLTDLTPTVGESGGIDGLRIVGRGWVDKLREVEKRAQEGGRRTTATEELSRTLAQSSVFGKNADNVRIVGVRDIEGYLIEFTIEAKFASVEAEPEGAEQE